jgi:spore coat polysaccharide biosynthesis protein SpsF
LKTGFIIICRYSSSRLPGKILNEIAGKPIIAYIIERIKRVTIVENIVVATSTENSDEPIVSWCNNNEIQVYCGSMENVALRFLNAARAFHFDFAFRVNGDNIFADVELLKEAYQFSQTTQYAFVSNLDRRSFPKGMSIEGVDINSYEDAFPEFNTQDCEHVMTYFYRHIDEFNHYFIYNENYPEMAGIQLAIDSPEDLFYATKIIAHFTKEQSGYGLNALSGILKEMKRG